MKSISFLFLLFLQLVAKGQAERYAVLIHEIMADPSPVIGLPNTEYIELKNNSNQAINLFHWKINNGTTTATINTQFLLQPDSFVIVCSVTVVSSITFSACFQPICSCSWHRCYC